LKERLQLYFIKNQRSSELDYIHMVVFRARLQAVKLWEGVREGGREGVREGGWVKCMMA